MFCCNSIWASRHSNRSSLSQAPLVIISGDDLITWDGLNPTIIKQTIPLYNSPFLSEPISLPPNYSSHFYKYISSNKRQISSDILPSFFKACAYLIASIFPFPILLNKDKDGKEKSCNNILYHCIDVYLRSNAYRVIFAE